MTSVLSSWPDSSRAVEDAADLVIALRHRGGVDLHHPRVDLLLVGAERIPGRNLLGPRRQHRVGRDDAQLLLPSPAFPRARLSQPWSNCPLNLAIQSLGAWCGAWLLPGAK